MDSSNPLASAIPADGEAFRQFLLTEKFAPQCNRLWQVAAPLSRFRFAGKVLGGKTAQGGFSGRAPSRRSNPFDPLVSVSPDVIPP